MRTSVTRALAYGLSAAVSVGCASAPAPAPPPDPSWLYALPSASGESPRVVSIPPPPLPQLPAPRGAFVATLKTVVLAGCSRGSTTDDSEGWIGLTIDGAEAKLEIALIRRRTSRSHPPKRRGTTSYSEGEAVMEFDGAASTTADGVWTLSLAPTPGCKNLDGGSCDARVDLVCAKAPIAFTEGAHAPVPGLQCKGERSIARGVRLEFPLGAAPGVEIHTETHRSSRRQDVRWVGTAE